MELVNFQRFKREFKFASRGRERRNYKSKLETTEHDDQRERYSRRFDCWCDPSHKRTVFEVVCWILWAIEPLEQCSRIETGVVFRTALYRGTARSIPNTRTRCRCTRVSLLICAAILLDKVCSSRLERSNLLFPLKPWKKYSLDYCIGKTWKLF